MAPDSLTELALERLGTVPGLDLAHGLANLNGKTHKYLSLLARFVANHRAEPACIRTQMMSGDYESARQMTHALKGVAGNMGAVTLQEMSARLETILRAAGDRDSSKATALIEEIEDEFAILSAALPNDRETGDPGPTAEPIDTGDRDRVLTELRTLLSDCDTKALSLSNSRAHLLKALFGNDFERFEAAIETYDFDAALDLLEEKKGHCAEP